MIKYFLNGIECNPLEREAIKFNVVFDSRRFGEFEMVLKNITFVKSDKKIIDDYIKQYGYGIAIPFTVHFTNGKRKEYYLNWGNSTFRENSITAEALLRNEHDNFWDRAQGLTFSDKKKFGWQPRDFVYVDFLVVPPEILTQMISLSVATAFIAREINNQVKLIAENFVAPAEATGNFGASLMRVAINIAYLTSMIIVIVKMINDILALTYPKMRQFKGIEIMRLIEKGCSQLGYHFDSSFLQKLKGLTLLPVPLVPKNKSYFEETFFEDTQAITNGYPTSRDSVFTLEQVISAIEQMFNLKTVVYDKKVRMEPSDYWQPNPKLVKSEAFNVQDKIEQEFTVNLREIYKRKVFVYQTDTSDFHTFDDTKGTVSELDTEAMIMSKDREDLELIKGLEMVNIPFSKAVRKNNLNIIERAMKVLAAAADVFTNGRTSKNIVQRAGAMVISQLFYGNTKILIRKGTSIDENQENIIGTDALINYHSSTFAQNNLKKIYSGMPVKMLEADFFELVQNNRLTLETGEEVEVVAIEWSEESQVAKIDYRITISDSKMQTNKLNLQGD